jgi:hypothetical protein
MIASILSAGCPDASQNAPGEFTWTTSEGSASPYTVGAETPQYYPPPHVDLSRLRAVVAAQALPADPSFLLGTHWRTRRPPPGEPRDLYFFGNMLTVRQRDGRTMTHVADYSVTHEGCLGYPLCIVTLNSNGTLAFHYLEFDGESFAFGECLNMLTFPRPTQAMLAEAGASVFHDVHPAFCFTLPNAPRYIPHYPNPNDNDDEPRSPVATAPPSEEAEPATEDPTATEPGGAPAVAAPDTTTDPSYPGVPIPSSDSE